jgi:ribosomal protein S18 acetylase RimI-like enzyme
VINDDALSFYRRLGFEVISEEKNFYRRIASANGCRNPADAYVLSKQISVP